MAHLDLAGPWHEASFRLVETYDVALEPGWRIALPHQPYGEVMQVISGRLRVELGDRADTVLPGEVAVLLPGSERLTVDDAGLGLRLRGFGFRMQLFGAIELTGALALPIRIAHPWPLLREHLDDVLHQGAEDSPVAALRARAAAELCVAALTERHGRPGPPRGVLRREVADALTLMEADPGAPADLGQIAAAVHLSPKHFARIFTSSVGVPPMAYLQALRLGHARRALVEEGRTIASIASDLGFADAAHFSRSFRRHHGCSPSEYRTRARAMAAGPAVARTSSPETRPDTSVAQSMGQSESPHDFRRTTSR